MDVRYILLTLVLLTGCSVFQDKQQELKLVGYQGKVYVNGIITDVPSTILVDRDKSVTVNAFKNSNLIFTKTIVPVQSVWGKLDQWGVYFLFPGIGLFSPGSMELETNLIQIQ